MSQDQPGEKHQKPSDQRANQIDSAAATEMPSHTPTVNLAGQRIGESIGRYRLVQKLGEGGFGIVYLAEQREPVKRRVALKIIKLGMDTGQVIARFEQERQALAMMSHPNIARVLDAGATETGRPYFVMELVNGLPLTEYCDRENLTTAARLRLFVHVCRAVQHAHQKGIIHRDLKPTNVLVAMEDDRPVPKVIDFGIAKATSSELTAKTIFTEQRQFIGTPEYMSPEQADDTGIDIDTRSDIYSLGVLLYELLTGTTPFDSARLRSAAYGEIRRIIREEQPPRPSTRLSTLGESASAIAQHRRDDPVHLTKSVRGDLDWIVMRCLEKERARRYETANGLAADLERFLANEPVLASPPSATYRFRKLVQRHRGVFIAGVIVSISLVLGMIGTGTGLVWALDERDNAAEQATRAEAKATTAQRVSDFLVGLFEASDPSIAAGEEITARMLLEEGERQIEALGDEPETQATLAETIGYVYLAMSDFESAAPLIEQAVAYREDHAADDELALARALHIQASLYQVRGDVDDAEPIIQRAIDIRRRRLGESREVAMSMNTLGNTLWHQGRMDEAEQLFRDTLDLQRRVLPPDHEDLGMAMHNLGGLRYFAGDLVEAEQFFREARDLAAKHHGTENIDYATSTHTISIIYMDLGRLEEAMDLQREALAIRQRVLGDVHWHVALSWTTLGNIQRKMRSFPEAVESLRKGVDVGDATLGPEHPEVWWMKRSLAGALKDAAQVDEAVSVLESLIATITESGSEVDLTLPLVGLAELRELKGALDEAAAHCRRAITAATEAYGERDSYVGQAKATLASVLRTQRSFDEAITEYEAAIDILTEAWGEEDSDRIDVVRAYIDMLVARERDDDAAAPAAELVKLYRALADADDVSPRRLNEAASFLLTCAVEDLRDPPTALAYSTRANDLTDRANFDFLRTLALAQFESGDPAAAAETQRMAISMIIPEHPDFDAMNDELARFEAELPVPAGF